MYNYNLPFGPDPNTMNPFNKMNELEQNINRLDREIKRINHRIRELENNNTYITKIQENTNNYNYDEDTGKYMV